MRKYCLLFIVITVLHHAAQFITWSFHPGNIVPGAIHLTFSVVARMGWSAFSFPLIWVAPEGLTNRHVELACWIHSIIWGLAGSAVIGFSSRTVRSSPQSPQS